MYIPEKIQIAGIEVKIEQQNGLMKTEKLAGKACYEKQIIYIDPEMPGPDILLQTLVHEVVHFILYVMGRDQLRQDEEFVDCFAHFAYQVMKEANNARCNRELCERDTLSDTHRHVSECESVVRISDILPEQ